MQLDPDLCYAALARRDARFDGRFFTAVRTTGVYCRPVCAARTPLRANVRFFACAAAAEAAGYRPCLRCRPETAPGTPAWQGTSATVSRALRLIADGALDGAPDGWADAPPGGPAGGGVEALAARLGMGARHLRRLFAEHLGVSPLAVAQTRRLHFARKLVDETPLPLTEVAFASGFASVRRFNDAFRAAYGGPPSALRRSRAAAGAHEASRLVLRLAYRPPLDWPALAAFLAARAIPGVEAVEAGAYRRTVRAGGATGVVEVRPVPGEAYLQLFVPAALAREAMAIAGRMRRLFDLDADPAEIDRHLAADPLLADAVARHPGLRVPGAWDGFELAVRAVLGQQVRVEAASALAGRLVRAFGEPLAGPPSPGLAYVFPTPERLADAPLEALGLPRQRAGALRALAGACHAGALDLRPGAGLEPAVAALTALPGVGAWTAHYVALRALGEPDAFPDGDLALRRAAAPGGGALTPSALRARAEAWRPWRAYAALHLWLLSASNSARTSASARRARSLETNATRTTWTRSPVP